MKRKVIQLAGKTSVISLPSKWVKNYNVNKGDELELEEHGSKVIINLSKTPEGLKKEIDVSNVEFSLNRVIGALYKAGYDEIKINFSNSKQLQIIHDVLNKTCVGIEIINQTKNSVTIKEISKPDPQEFDKVLRRCFLFLNSNAKESLEAIQKYNQDQLKNIILRDSSVNKYADFCRRLLNVKGLEDQRATSTTYHIVEQLEKIGDSYKHICKLALSNKTKLNPSTVKIFNEVNSSLELFYNLFYEFNLNKFESFVSKLETLKNDIIKTKGSTEIMFHLDNILNMMFDMNGSLITKNL